MLQSDLTEFGDDGDGTVERFHLLANTSRLFRALCDLDTTSGACRFRGTVVLGENLPCDGMECAVDTARTVRLNITENGETFPVYYEYVRPACVELAYYQNATTIASRGGSSWNSHPFCAK